MLEIYPLVHNPNALSARAGPSSRQEPGLHWQSTVGHPLRLPGYINGKLDGKEGWDFILDAVEWDVAIQGSRMARPPYISHSYRMGLS